MIVAPGYEAQSAYGVSVNVWFCFTIQIALADHVPLTGLALDANELVIAPYPEVVLPVRSAPPPTSFAPPVHEAVAGPNVVPGF